MVADSQAENYIAPSPSRVSQMGMVIDAAAHGTGGDIQAGCVICCVISI